MTDAAPDLTGDPVASRAALAGEGGWWERPRDVVVVAGPDAATYLQGQLSQDVQALAVGASAATFLLQPDGKVTAWLRATRAADDRFVLDTDPGWGSAVVDRLRRFLLRVKVELSLVAAGDVPPAVAVRMGNGVLADAARPAGSGSGSTVVAATVAGDLPGFDVLVLAEGARVGGELPALARVDPAGYELVRVERRLPAMGAELDDTTIPAEAGEHVIEASVSFTKGCYTGQELVARVDSRGNNVPRRIRTLRVDAADVPAGAEVVTGDKVVGHLTTAVGPVDGGTAALASLARSVAEGATVAVRTPAGDATAVAD
jgi:folate-binding protein YgfZ